MEGSLESEDSGGKRTTEIIATIECLFHGVFIISYYLESAVIGFSMPALQT